MRCDCVNCHYNDDNFCKSPDYVQLDKNGECTQMYLVGKTLAEKYRTLRRNMDMAYEVFDSDPTQANSDTYGIALGEFQDFCVQAVEELINQRPDIANSCIVEDD
jgi:hypothetical protein